MRIKNLQMQWERFGAADPMSAVLADSKEGGRVWAPEEFFAIGRADVSRWLHRLAELGGAASGQSALDFGCGVGRLSQALSDRFDSVVGVDVSRPMLAAAERWNGRPERVRYVHNAQENLRLFDDGSFDLVLTHIVLQHLDPELAERYLAEFLRVLRPGGSLIFQIPTERIQDRWRYSVVAALPRLVRAYRRMRRGVAPHMEMNALPVTRIEKTMKAGSGVVLGVDPDSSAGPAFRSAMYYVAKRPADPTSG